MSGFDIYVFFVCFFVFLILGGLFTYMIVSMVKNEMIMIKHGILDAKIQDHMIKKNSKSNKVFTIIEKTFLLLLSLFLSAAFGFSVYMNITEDRPANGVPSIKVVKSNSMSYANEKNKYLKENNLTNQFQTFDIIICEHLPKEEDLKLYDIVVYKQDDIYVIHRIVGIEEPNEKHPNERHFLLQGDAVDRPDKFPVLYSQMKGIYRGQRIPFAGSIVLFLQSPAGWLCILLVLFALIGTPIVEHQIDGAIYSRLNVLEESINLELENKEHD